MFNLFNDKQLRKDFEELKENLEHFKDNIIMCDECGILIFKYSAIEKKFIEKSINVWGEEIEVCITKCLCNKCNKKYQKK